MATFKPNFNLSAFFNKESKTASTQYKRLLSLGRGILNDDAPRKKKNNRKPWLVNTGETRQKGIERKNDKYSMTIYASAKKHSGRTRYITKKGEVRTGTSKNRPTYKQLFKYHNQGRSSASSETYSGIFNELPLNSAFPDRLKAEVYSQTQREIGRLVRASNRKRGAK